MDPTCSGCSRGAERLLQAPQTFVHDFSAHSQRRRLNFFPEVAGYRMVLQGPQCRHLLGAAILGVWAACAKAAT